MHVSVYCYSGTRHTLTAAETLSTDSVTYIGNFEIDGNFLTKYYFNNGYLYMGNTGGGTYHYTVKDHLGNVRAVVNENGTVEQINNYYAYGGLLNDVTTGTDVQTHKYNGKEFDCINTRLVRRIVSIKTNKSEFNRLI